MNTRKVYSQEWFSGLQVVDAALCRELRGLIRARRTAEICLVCKNPANRDYAIVGAKHISVLRLCPCCRAAYIRACGSAAVLPFVGRMP